MAEPRQSNRWDGTLNSVNFRIKRMEDGAGYRRDTQRSNLIFNQSEEHQAQFNSRNDIRTLYQTSWADGAFWNKPLLNAASINSYNISEGIDLLTEPGSLLPLGTTTTTSSLEGSLSGWCGVAVPNGDIFMVEDGAAGNLGAYLYDASAGSWSQTSSDFAIADWPLAVCYSLEQDSYVVLGHDGNTAYMAQDGTSSSAIRDIGSPQLYGPNIFFHFGRLFVYDGDILIEITDPFGTDGQTTIFDDGMGPDWLNGIAASDGGSTLLRQWTVQLAIATGEGIYIVKNVEQQGIPVATIHRVDRTNTGIDVGTPVATLPPGYVALDIAYHLGSVLVSATSDYQFVSTNDTSSSEYPGIDIFHLTNGSLGAVGSPLGYENPDEAPFRFCGSYEGSVFIGGQKRLWRYDAVRGGLHPIMNVQRGGGETGRIPSFVSPTLNASGVRVIRAIDDEGRYYEYERFTGTDNDSDTRQLDSNYFAFNIPAEKKTISHVTLMTDGVQSGETWTVSLDTDDGGFSSVATFTSSDDNTTKKRITPVTGYRFRYRLAYSASGAVASPSRVKGIVFHAIHGEMVTRWQLVIDGSEFTNVQNTVLRPDDVVSDWESIAAQQGVVSFTDSFGLTSSTHNVKVEQVQITRSSPQEVDSVTCVLTEDT